MNYPTYIRAVWRAVWCFWIAVLILAPIIAIQALVSALRSGERVPWTDVAGATGMMFAATAIVWLLRHWFNLAAGSKVCNWRLDR
jgi:hypothetical protein